MPPLIQAYAPQIRQRLQVDGFLCTPGQEPVPILNSYSFAVPLLLPGATSDTTITIPAVTNNTYPVAIKIVGSAGLLGSTTAVVLSKDVSSFVVRVTNTGLSTLLAGGYVVATTATW